MSSYESLLTEIRQIVSTYSLATLLNGFTPDLINILMRGHMEKVKLADTYESTESLINAAITHQVGCGMVLSSFITTEADRHRLYTIFSNWRTQLLAEVDA